MLDGDKVVVHGDDTALASVKAVGERYPLRGTLKMAAEPFGPARAVGVPAAGEAWVDLRLWQELRLARDVELQVGALKLRVTLTPTGSSVTLPGTITIFCVIGPKAPTPHDNPTQTGEEGITAVVPSVANFNKIVSGMNLYVRTS